MSVLFVSGIFCLLFVAGSFAHAQSTFGSVRGNVLDVSGAAIPGAQIVLHSTDEDTERTVDTDASGAFIFENVKAGKYTLRAHRDGFADTVVSGISVEARQDLRLGATLNVAAEATTVEVSGAADQINTENGTIGDSKTNIEMTQLPLNNRATTTSPLGALALSPNVQTDSAGNIALGGASSSMVNFSVDGISTANVRQNGALQDAYPSQEGIAAVKVTSFNNSAEFSQIGDVTFTTKNGTSEYHGSVFEYLQNQALDADPYGSDSKAPKKFNTFGFSLSGPVVIPHLYDGHSKTFFFADYEGNRRSTAVFQQEVVPTAADRSGDLSDIGGPTIAATQINATAKALLGYYPMPNVPGATNQTKTINYQNFQATPSHTDGADIRVDQTISSKQSAYARFSRKNISSAFANLFLPDDVDSIHNRSLLISHTYSITPRLLNEFRYGFTNVTTNVNFPIQGSTALSQLDLNGVDISQHPLTHAFPTFNFSASTPFPTIGRDKAGITQSRTTQFSDNLTYTFGRHTVKGGIDVRRVRYFDLESFAPEFASDDFGNFVFQPQYGQAPGQEFTGNAFGDFLEGAPTTLYFAVSSPDVGGTATQYSFFGQDEFQVNSRITLSYGLRWQILPGFQEDGGNLANFDQRNNSIVVPDALAGYLTSQNITSSNIAFQQSFNACPAGTAAGSVVNGISCTAYVTASQDGLPQGLRQTYKGDFQPRVSIAYRPFNDTKTVVRAGFGVYTMTNLGPLSFNNSGNPTSNLHIYSNSNSAGQNTPQIVFPNTAPATTGGPTFGGGGLDQGVNPNFRDPQSNQWNVTVERQLSNATSLRASYVGMHSYRLNITEDLNQIPASTIPYNSGATAGVFVDNRAPYQNWTTLYSTFNAGEANYHAFEVQATHRLEHGLYLDANYTYANNVADNQGDAPNAFAGEVNYGLPIADHFHVKQDLGNVSGTRHNRMLLTGMYQLPFGKGRQFMNTSAFKDAILGGWDLTTITLLETGPWLTPSISGSADQSNTNVVNRGAVLRPDVVSAGTANAVTYNNMSFLATPVGAGRFGNAGVGIIQGPGTATVSLGVAKRFTITERVHARFETTFTNVLNHTNFAPPVTAIDNSLFGQLTGPQTAENAGNRTGQAALRIDF
ncbi:carboxypeptidase-like regulatory domain-containing protein [Acidicapsa ligni]|uniref:carboxypeptidase-like regulatory domain-containing protein n=1 Tax=Acidicapsa ligni TaxID=542300 RepID=UPI0021E05C60|nr:carboxypeptidase-like regulatory domain-containing protein [Acidicapsa ligni]